MPFINLGSSNRVVSFSPGSVPRPALPGVNSQGRCPGRQLVLEVWPVLTLGVSVFLILSLIGLLLVRAN